MAKPFSDGRFDMEWEDPGCSDLCLRSTETGCEIFDTRPFVCRIFFKSEDFPYPCPRGLQPDTLVSAELFRRIIWCWLVGTVLDARAIYAWGKDERTTTEKENQRHKESTSIQEGVAGQALHGSLD